MLDSSSLVNKQVGILIVLLGAGGSVGVTYDTGLEEAPGPLELFLQLDPQHSNDTSPLHSLLTSGSPSSHLYWPVPCLPGPLAFAATEIWHVWRKNRGN